MPGGGGKDFTPVSAVVLGLVESDVGLVKDVSRGEIGTKGGHGDAHADGGGYGSGRRVDGLVGHLGANLFRAPQAVGQVAAGQDDNEFFPAVASTVASTASAKRSPSPWRMLSYHARASSKSSFASGIQTIGSVTVS